MKFQATETIAQFKCLQADCPDTCCRGWSMQLDDATFAKYKGTELEKAVDYDGINKEIRVMKREKSDDHCVKLIDGICSIHAAKGPEMLGDACNLYPRVIRKFDDELLMTGTLSCPEIARLALKNNQSFTEVENDRIPFGLKNNPDNELKLAAVTKIHQSFLQLCESEEKPGDIMAAIYSTAMSLSRIAKTDWQDAAAFFAKNALGKLPPAQTDSSDSEHLFQIFAAVFHATGKKMPERLAEVIIRLQSYIGIKINWGSLELSIAPKLHSAPRNMDEILRKYIAAQLSFNTFPIGGIGENLADKARLICFKFAFTRLCLNAFGDKEAEIIQAIQAPARIIDHIADPTLILTLMDRFGFTTAGRIRGLVS